jgi:streptogramin lyase
MKTIAIFLCAAALLVSAPARRTFTGVLTDKMCGADHSMMKVKPDSKCVRECVKAGAPYALAAGGSVYTLSNAKGADDYTGQKVRVAGTLDGKTGTITVDSITPAK